MRAAQWKQLACEKGWLTDNRFVVPSGYILDIFFGRDCLNIFCHSAVEVISDDAFIIETKPDLTKYFLWEDVSSMHIRREPRLR
jgi:hypothetical protein